MAIDLIPSNRSVLIGYFPKRVYKRPEWLNNPKVLEICSVSECISKGPDGWVDHWRHNEMLYFDTPELARSVVPIDSMDKYKIFAYQLLPIEFKNLHSVDFFVQQLSTVAMPLSFSFLGFDVVSKSAGYSFECSGLSCNHGAETEPVNKYCLVENESDAIRIAKIFADESQGYEPGPYFVVEVWRDSIQ